MPAHSFRAFVKEPLSPDGFLIKIAATCDKSSVAYFQSRALEIKKHYVFWSHQRGIDVRRVAVNAGLTFEDAMSVHVLRARGMIFSELTRRFGANPARFHEILCGNLYPGSWEAAVEQLANNDSWHPEIAQLVKADGLADILAAVNAVNPAKRRFQQQLKRLRKSAPPTAPAQRPQPATRGGGVAAYKIIQR